MRKSLLILASLVAAVTPAAFADSIVYTLTGQGQTYTFTAVLPTGINPNYAGLTESYTTNNTTTNDFLPVFVYFVADPDNLFTGDIQINDINDDLLVLTGPPLYTGPDADPTYALGTFDLVGEYAQRLSFDPVGQDYVLTAAYSTPEPSSLLLLGTGVLGLAGAARRRFLKA